MKYAVVVKGRDSYVVVETPGDGRIGYVAPREIGSEGTIKITEGAGSYRTVAVFRTSEVSGVFAVLHEEVAE